MTYPSTGETTGGVVVGTEVVGGRVGARVVVEGEVVGGGVVGAGVVGDNVMVGGEVVAAGVAKVYIACLMTQFRLVLN